MDDQSKKVIDIGEKFIKMMQDEPNSPFDLSDQSIEYLQGVVATLKDSNPNPNYSLACKIGSAMYLAKVLMKHNPHSKMEVLFENDKLLDIQLRNDKATLNLLSWVNKCVDDPEGDNLVFKFKRAKELF